MKLKKGCQVISLIGMLILLGAMSVWGWSEPVTPFSANVMAPLHVMNYNDPDRMEVPLDWQSFENELKVAKELGVAGVSVDVWWGDVEAQGDNQFDWSYYREVFQRIKAAGLQMIPIIGFHQCGGNVGDTYTSALPGWLWDAIKGSHNVTDLKYQSELGNYSDEFVSLWADELVFPEYQEFMEAFAQFLIQNQFTGAVAELNVSCGPAGELRYPSYNSHDWIYDATTESGFWEKYASDGRLLLKGDRTNWPHRGALQCYGKLALADFQHKMKLKYCHLRRLQAAWGPDGRNLTGFAAIQLPNQGSDHGYPDGKVFKADGFFQSGAYYKSQYGRDLIEWYHQSLLDHGRRMLELARRVFRGPHFRQVPLGIKIPGVHWQMGTLGGAQPVAPRAAELTAGLIRPGKQFAAGFDLDNASVVNGHGYAELIRMCKAAPQPVNLHFTCLEMGNSEDGGAGETPKQFSLAKSLVGWVAAEAYRQGVTLKGENALSGGLAWVNEDFPERTDWVIDAWDHLNQALERYPYAGITILRMTDVTTVQNPENGQTVGREHYQNLINRFQQSGPTKEAVTIYYQGRKSQFKNPYQLLVWSNHRYTAYPMEYAGFHHQGHWWKVTLNAPPYFKFSLSEQPLVTRIYTRYPNNDNQVGPQNTVYVRAGDPLVYYGEGLK